MVSTRTARIPQVNQKLDLHWISPELPHLFSWGEIWFIHPTHEYPFGERIPDYCMGIGSSWTYFSLLIFFNWSFSHSVYRLQYWVIPPYISSTQKPTKVLNRQSSCLLSYGALIVPLVVWECGSCSRRRTYVQRHGLRAPNLCQALLDDGVLQLGGIGRVSPGVVIPRHNCLGLVH